MKSSRNFKVGVILLVIALTVGIFAALALADGNGLKGKGNSNQGQNQSCEDCTGSPNNGINTGMGNRVDAPDDDGDGIPQLTPRFIHVCRERREETVYLRKYMTEGCRMNVSTNYITVEKIGFAIQSIDSVPPNEENALLDPLELEVASFDELKYQVITAQHHVDYTGGGSGELFFPMEATDFSVGQRGSGGGGGGLEPERGSFLG